MDLSLLATLKQKLQKEKRFSEVLDYFLTNFGEKPEFIALGQRIEEPFLELVLEQVAKQLFKKGPTRIEQLLLTQLPGESFIHGGFMVNGHLGTVMYFEDVPIGLAVLSMLGGQTHYARFTGRPMTPRPIPSAN